VDTPYAVVDPRAAAAHQARGTKSLAGGVI